ncbi:MAG: HU family DNA-binding protein [Lutibacter sp.]|nr:HU family DNA-binding protein [Lutibacter sp.]
MNKGELVDAIAKDANLSKADAGNALNAFIVNMSEELNNGNCVKLIVPVAINKGLREGGKTVPTNDKNQQGYTKESAMIFVKVDETSLRNSNTKIPKDQLIQENDKRMSESAKARTLRTADKRYSEKRDERAKVRTLRTADKRYRETIRDKENTIQNDKPVQITTEENNTVNPSNNLDTRFLKAQNYETIQISKSKFQLTAPLLIDKDQNEIIVYNWTVKNKIKNKVAKFTGKTINYDFDDSGTYEIEIIPVINNKNLNPFHINIICD